MNPKEELQSVYNTLNIASQNAKVLAESFEIPHSSLEYLLDHTEQSAIKLRNIYECINKVSYENKSKPPAPKVLSVVGNISVNERGWLHIELNTLLPNCRFKSPLWLQETLNSLLMELRQKKKKLPFYTSAMLIIEEHCNIENRIVYDQDNKGWKAIPNALKGFVIPDDEQFTLEIALLTKKSDSMACHIWVLPKEDTAEFFSVCEL